jgi:hypothetical protein
MAVVSHNPMEESQNQANVKGPASRSKPPKAKTAQDRLTFWLLVFGGLFLGFLIAVFFLTAFLYVVLPVLTVALLWTFVRHHFFK